MSQRAVDAIFQGLYFLTDLRVIMRESAPLHNLTEDQKKIAEKSLTQLEKQIAILKEELQ